MIEIPKRRLSLGEVTKYPKQVTKYVSVPKRALEGGSAGVTNKRVSLPVPPALLKQMVEKQHDIAETIEDLVASGSIETLINGFTQHLEAAIMPILTHDTFDSPWELEQLLKYGGVGWEGGREGEGEGGMLVTWSNDRLGINMMLLAKEKGGKWSFKLPTDALLTQVSRNPISTHSFDTLKTVLDAGGGHIDDIRPPLGLHLQGEPEFKWVPCSLADNHTLPPQMSVKDRSFLKSVIKMAVMRS